MIAVPDAQALSAVQEIGRLTQPFGYFKGHADLFGRAMQEIVVWHARRNEVYAQVLRNQGFDPAGCADPLALATIPFIPANIFKKHEILSIHPDDVMMHLTSSGTSGQKSQMFFDRWSLTAGQGMVDSVFQAAGFVTPDVATNYLLYSYETSADAKLGTAYTDNYLCKFAPVRSAFCALKLTGSGGHDFDVFGTIQALQRYEAEGAPVRIFGFPAFFAFTLNRMRALKIPALKLPPSSLVFLGGGWKGHADKAIPKHELYQMVHDQLGIDPTRIRDSFGAVEHAIPYAECTNHHFHVPVWSKVIIRDVRTLRPVEDGRAGFLQFLTPFITSVPAHSVLMGDMASLSPADACGCGISSPFFTVHGRAGTTKNRSCAVAASELLGR